MKTWRIFLLFCAVPTLFAVELFAQGTTFTYQGRLNDNGNPANGNYDFRFSIYSSSGGGGLVAGPVTNSAVAVNNGGFVVNLDFGPGVFTGPARWLDIGVRPNGGTNGFTVLSPRQMLTPTPYAIFADTASNLSGTLPTTQLVGLLPATQLSGTLPASAFEGYTNTVALTNSGNLFAGSFSGSFTGAFNGAFNGNGGSVTNVNVTHLTGILANNQLPADTAYVDSNQTFVGANHFAGPNNFSGTNFFGGPNTFTNFGNSFVGSFFGNGLVGWIPTNGASVQATIDTGYLLTNSGVVTVTLPTSAQPRDIVRIAGAGGRGWLVNENSGQSIVGNFANYGNSYLVGLSSSGNYHDVAASAGGIPIYVVGNGFSGVYVSYDYGRNWSSASGTFSLTCQSVACSANGQIVYAVTTSGVVYKSTDSGATWSTVGSGYTTISCSADGSQAFGNVECSGDGTYRAYFNGSTIYVSTNGGSSWFTIPAPSGTISCLAVSSDCTRLIAGINNGRLYGSANSGATWTPITTSNQYWAGAWMSADGSRFAAVVAQNGGTPGSFYEYRVDVQSDTVSTNSTISGSQGTAVELQAVGNNRWMPVSSTGTIWAY